MSLSAQARTASDETKRKISEANKKRKHSIETKQKMSETRKAFFKNITYKRVYDGEGKWHYFLLPRDPEISPIRQKLSRSETMRKRWSEPLYKNKRSEATKKLWTDPLYKMKRAEAQKKFYEQKNKTLVLSCQK